MEFRLAPFDESSAESVLGWVRSPEELHAWASVVEEPTPALLRRWHGDPDVHPYVLFVDHELSAYGEIWEDAAEDEAELARILVAPARRGRGIGRRFTELLAERARERGFDQIWVRVLPSNAPALACYRSAGFVRTTTEEEDRFNRGQPRSYAWMRLSSVSH